MQLCGEELGQSPGGLYACVCVGESEQSRGIPGDSRGNGSAPSSTVLLRWWMERSVCRMLSAVALARAAAREHGQLLW